ncbi:response regulator [Frigidibacter sp. ROC022]|uniref:response regulator n=1 Tax=Frigidibacter sp. ROC022 TaxID=2971796 RepID=UPI00215B11D9|nr:response regulator [Frigidibacter sp. ROC022]MCR8725042.1 response regulator [Frigidibacter sp. ROC022]
MALRETLRIMVVDDMSTSRGLIVQALEWMGIKHILESPDAADALGSLAKTPVHLVLSDYNMPGMDGLALLRKLRSMPATARLGFILITGRADAAMVSEGQRLGMNNLITKPFTPQSLKDCIERVVGRL